MNFYNFHVNDFRGATWHLDRLHRSIYRDLIDEYYLTEKPLIGDVAMLAHKMGCRSEAEQAALTQVLGEFFTKKNGKYHHKRIDRELKNYHYRHATNATLATDDETNATQHATDVQRECNSSTQRSQKARLRKKLQDKFGLNPDKSMSLYDLQALYEAQFQHAATDDETNATQHATDVQRECNAKKSSITKNQEPINKTTHSLARETDWDDVCSFRMRLDWQPSKNAIANLHMAGLGKDLTAYPLGLVKFRNYWTAENAELTQAQWESKFVSFLVDDKTKQRNDFAKPIAAQKTDVAAPSTTKPNAPSKTAQSYDTLTACRQMVLSGSLTTTLAPNVCLVLIDGLLSLLGSGLKYPPAADAWQHTLTVWADELARVKLTHDDSDRLRTAFDAAKRRALSDGSDKHFPSVHDVIACLPRKLVPRVEHKKSAEENAKRNEAGRAQTAKLFALLGGKVA